MPTAGSPLTVWQSIKMRLKPRGNVFMYSGGAMFISYLRVSTQRQGQSGLGLEALREAVVQHLRGRALVKEFVEIESGGKADRPQLKQALNECRKSGATLVFAKLDRLARDTKLVLEIADSQVPVVFCDFPNIPEGAAGRFLLTMLASVAEFERRRISERTKAALAATKARGVVLGANLSRNVEARQAAANSFAERLRGVVEGCKARRMIQRGIMEELNQQGVKTPAGSSAWTLVQVQRLIKRLNMAE